MILYNQGKYHKLEICKENNRLITDYGLFIKEIDKAYKEFMLYKEIEEILSEDTNSDNIGN